MPCIRLYSFLILISSVWIISARPHNQKPEQTQPFPVNIKVMDERPYKYGRILNVECAVADSQADYEMNWIRENALVRGNFYRSYNKILMEIKGVIPMDFGKYTCVARRRDGMVSTNSVTFKRDRDSGSGFVYDVEHSSVVEFIKEIVQPDKDDDHDHDSNEKSFEENRNGLAIGNINNDRTIRIVEEFQTYTHDGETVKFTCEVEGRDNGGLRWEKNMAKLPDNHEIRDNVLILKKVRPEDTGYYICVYGERSASVFLGIANKDDPITFVRIKADKKLVNADKGDTVRLDCVVVGELKTRIWWQKHLSDDVPRNMKVIGNQLVLENVEIENFGYYECFGENSLGLFSDFIYLDIEERPFRASEHQHSEDEDQFDERDANKHEYEENQEKQEDEEYQDEHREEEHHRDEENEDEHREEEHHRDEDNKHQDEGQKIDVDFSNEGYTYQDSEKKLDKNMIMMIKDDNSGYDKSVAEIDYIADYEAKNEIRKAHYPEFEMTSEQMNDDSSFIYSDDEVTLVSDQEPNVSESFVDENSDVGIFNSL